MLCRRAQLLARARIAPRSLCPYVQWHPLFNGTSVQWHPQFILCSMAPLFNGTLCSMGPLFNGPSVQWHSQAACGAVVPTSCRARPMSNGSRLCVQPNCSPCRCPARLPCLLASFRGHGSRLCVQPNCSPCPCPALFPCLLASFRDHQSTSATGSWPHQTWLPL